MMVELLAAGLIGERFSFEAAEHDNKDGGPSRGGEFLLAMDPARIVQTATRLGLDVSHSDSVERALKTIPTTNPAPRVLICGTLYLAGSILATISQD